MLRVSVVVPSLVEPWLKLLLRSLRDQTIKPWEIVVVVKPRVDKDVKYVEELCKVYDLNCVVVEQSEGFFTRALNMGKKGAGYVMIFADGGAIAFSIN